MKKNINIDEILSALCSKEITALSASANIRKEDLLPLIIKSKTGFDKIVSDRYYNEYLEEIADTICYKENRFVRLVNYVSKMDASTNKNNHLLVSFFRFHETVFKVASIAGRLLIKMYTHELYLKDGNTKIISLSAGKNDSSYKPNISF